MRKILPLLLAITLSTGLFNSCRNPRIYQEALISAQDGDNDEENEKYDGPAQRDSIEFEKLKDPALGYVPAGRLVPAIDFTEGLKNSPNSRTASALLWSERGPIFDSVGPSNGNTRGGGGVTSGRMTAILVDYLNDPTGNTVFAGGIAGGLWKCTNFLSGTANWQVVNDYFENLAISTICQDPTNPAIMYFATGEPTANADAVNGAGVWKSTDGGATWSRLASTINFIRTFKLACDAAGNVYLAARVTVTPVAQSFGLMRSKDKGVTWTNITPANLTSTNGTCTDIEISSTGKMHASFGYSTATNSVINYRYTTDPANVTTTTGWTTGTGIRISNYPACRLQLASIADTLYGLTVSSATFDVDSCYKSIDGGNTWTKQNTAVYTTGLGSQQGWYAVTLSINPLNTNEFLAGGLDAYRSTNSGQTITRQTFWVTSIPYVHADHHYMEWKRVNGESRVIIGCDGGIFLSRDAGVTWADRNRNLGIKQFYAADIHPTANTSYFIAGAQDNGTQQIKTPGLTYSYEVVGGDGFFVHINQQNPLIQFGAYVYNQYRRSVDGGQTWSSINFSASNGMFVNPWDYDDAKNILYGCYTTNQMIRWPNANTSTSASLITFTGLGTPSAFKVSPTTADRLYIGSNTGKLFRLDHADVYTGATVATDLKDITGASFPAGAFLNCVNVGSSDNFLVAVFTNYGINNIWYSKDAGTTWSAIDGNLPDMPIRWAMFVPGHDDQLMIATETGVFTTDLVNGASTVWNTNPGFPTVRTDMLKMRTSDNTVVAATHGRGLFTATFPNTNVPEVRFTSSSTIVTEDSLNTNGCRRYRDYTVNVGIINAPTGDATVTINVQAGNTATQGVDFDFTTNGSFTTPSNQIVFKNGVVAEVPITIRVYDDAEVEPTESFTLGFTVSGATNAIAGTSQTHIFTILDNDAAPIVFGPVTASLGTYDGTDLASLVTPFDGTKLKHRLQVLFTSSELKAAGFSSSAPINSMTIRVKTKNTTHPFNGFTVSIGNTASTSLNTGFVLETLTPVYTANYSTVAGSNTFNFSTPFVWNGTSNIAVQFCYDNTGTTAEGVTDVVEGNATPLGAAFRASTYSNYTNQAPAGCSLAAAFVNSSRLDAVFTANLGNPVASALGTSKTEYLNSNNDLYYYSSAGEIIARVRNLSAQNYGCTQVIIDRAGTGVTQFWNTIPANYLMNKTFQILPTTNNPSGKYEVTFYYTKAEKEGWEAATGQSWNNIQLIKVPSRINNVTPLNAQPDGSGTVQIVTPVRGTYGADYTLDYTFDNGFAGYGAGIPGRINTILILSGQVDANLKDIYLSWTTSAEMGSTQFQLEKSYDGITFFNIANIAASGTKFSPTTYTYVDHEFVQINYYRVRLLHSDGFTVLSNTIFIKNDNVPQRLIVLTNPFSNSLNIRLSRASTLPIDFRLYDMESRLIKKYIAAPGTLNISINTNGIISKGVYQLRAYIDNQVFYRTLLKQ